MTNPSRSSSNGREACAGSSLRVLIARITLNAAYVIGASGASAPPASITSARPSRIVWNEIGEHTSELQSHSDLVCRLLLEKKKKQTKQKDDKSTANTKPRA